VELSPNKTTQLRESRDTARKGRGKELSKVTGDFPLADGPHRLVNERAPQLDSKLGISEHKSSGDGEAGCDFL
jgi:hypothetical protein